MFRGHIIKEVLVEALSETRDQLRAIGAEMAETRREMNGMPDRLCLQVDQTGDRICAELDKLSKSLREPVATERQ